MFNRRHLRIKVLHCFYAYFQDDDKDLNHADKQLKTSLDKMYEMYVWLLSLVVEMQDHAIDKIEAGRNKKLPSPEDLHPNTKFVTNSFIRLLANSKVLNNKCEELAVNWSQERDLSKKIFKELIQTEDYKEYMEFQVVPTLREMFFETYPEKIWGIQTEQMTPDWAPKRIEFRNKITP